MSGDVNRKKKNQEFSRIFHIFHNFVVSSIHYNIERICCRWYFALNGEIDGIDIVLSFDD